MKITIPEDWIAGRWWQNRILWCLWGFGGVLSVRRWLETRGSLWIPIITFIVILFVASFGFILADFTQQRRNRRNSYRLPKEK
jgi:hypothetical protein